MSSRRLSREAAVQLLYQCDTSCESSPHDVESCLTYFSSRNSECGDSRPLVSWASADREVTLELVLGVLNHTRQIDEIIQAASMHRSVARIPPTDRAILRLAIYELLFRPDVPSKVAINEAIEIAKRFSADEAPRFINGVLHSALARVRADLGESTLTTSCS